MTCFLDNKSCGYEADLVPDALRYQPLAIQTWLLLDVSRCRWFFNIKSLG
jgi:hypothetical protein